MCFYLCSCFVLFVAAVAYIAYATLAATTLTFYDTRERAVAALCAVRNVSAAPPSEPTYVTTYEALEVVDLSNESNQTAVALALDDSSVAAVYAQQAALFSASWFMFQAPHALLLEILSIGVAVSLNLFFRSSQFTTAILIVLVLAGILFSSYLWVGVLYVTILDDCWPYSTSCRYCAACFDPLYPTEPYGRPAYYYVWWSFMAVALFSGVLAVVGCIAVASIEGDDNLRKKYGKKSEAASDSEALLSSASDDAADEIVIVNGDRNRRRGGADGVANRSRRRRRTRDEVSVLSDDAVLQQKVLWQ